MSEGVGEEHGRDSSCQRREQWGRTLVIGCTLRPFTPMAHCSMRCRIPTAGLLEYPRVTCDNLYRCSVIFLFTNTLPDHVGFTTKVMDFSEAECSGFTCGFITFWTSQRDNAQNWQELQVAAECLLKGCCEHYLLVLPMLAIFLVLFLQGYQMPSKNVLLLC